VPDRFILVLPAVVWDQTDPHNPIAPSVLERLREKASRLRDEDFVCELVGLVFVQPDSRVIQTAEGRKDYFDAWTGESWDLYFPGYYRWGSMPSGRRLTAQADGPQFSPIAFDELRRVVEGNSNWRYSGDCDLVVVNTFLVSEAEPIVDWASLLGGPLVDPNDAYRALSLGGVIEAISQAVERDFNTSDWNVGGKLWPADRAPDSRILTLARDALANAVSNVLTSPLTPSGSLESSRSRL
jgi:hypothetical protein